MPTDNVILDRKSRVLAITLGEDTPIWFLPSDRKTLPAEAILYLQQKLGRLSFSSLCQCKGRDVIVAQAVRPDITDDEVALLGAVFAGTEPSHPRPENITLDEGRRGLLITLPTNPPPQLLNERGAGLSKAADSYLYRQLGPRSCAIFHKKRGDIPNTIRVRGLSPSTSDAVIAEIGEVFAGTRPIPPAINPITDYDAPSTPAARGGGKPSGAHPF